MELTSAERPVEADYSYTLKVLGQAVDCLATGRGNLKVRLMSAMISLMPLTEDDFLPSQRSRYKRLDERCNKNPSKEVWVKGEGSPRRAPSGTLAATIPHMHWTTAEAIAREIIRLEAELNWHVHNCD